MTDRVEIERLLNLTGRTLEGLPEEHSAAEVIDCITSINAGQGAYRRATVFAQRILHQSDVIELLVGALRDALEKPMQKPLTLTQATSVSMSKKFLNYLKMAKHYSDERGDSIAAANLVEKIAVLEHLIVLVEKEGMEEERNGSE